MHEFSRYTHFKITFVVAIFDQKKVHNPMVNTFSGLISINFPRKRLNVAEFVIKVAHQYVLSNNKIKIWGYCTIFVDIFTKTTVFVNQKYFRTIGASTYSVGFTACDAFQTLSWSACCVCPLRM